MKTTTKHVKFARPFILYLLWGLQKGTVYSDLQSFRFTLHF